MRRPRPVFLKWDGDVFVPEPSFKAYCDREYCIGEVYPMLPVEERSQSSHNHYFAALAEGFNNLSEENAKHFPTVEHLRHWALVQSGYAEETEFSLTTTKEARKLAAELRKINIYAVMSIRDTVLKIWTAESQSMAAMKKQRFEESKRAVLDLVAGMARTTPAQLNREAHRHGR
jgi:hypothetical protein